MAGYATLLRDALEGDKRLQREAGEILAAAHRATALTRQLLAFGRKQVLQPRPLALNAALGELHGFLQRAAGEDVAVELDLSSTEPWTFADRGQLEQVVLNLVVNARDALPAGGTVRIATGVADVEPGVIEGLHPGPYAVLTVADDGTGMRDEVRERAFEPFFTTKERGRGSGLGLATVFGIVAQSGGHVSLESAVGDGTTVRVILPSHEPARDPREHSARPDAGACAGETPHALLVEDDSQVRSITQAMLERLGYRVATATDGEEALALPGLAEFDVVVTDVVMPRMGGWELVDHLRRRLAHVPVLLVSGHAADLVPRDGLPAGVAFLEKPFDVAALGSALASLRRCVPRSRPG